EPSPTAAEARAALAAPRGHSPVEAELGSFPLPLPPQPPAVSPNPSSFIEAATPDNGETEEKPALSLTDVQVRQEQGSPSPLETEARGRIEHDIDTATYVQAKAVCRVKGRLVADTGYVNSDDAHALADMQPGNA